MNVLINNNSSCLYLLFTIADRVDVITPLLTTEQHLLNVFTD